MEVDSSCIDISELRAEKRKRRCHLNRRQRRLPKGLKAFPSLVITNDTAPAGLHWCSYCQQILMPSFKDKS
jgi:hypothetical protein